MREGDTADLVSSPRFPAVARSAAHYESFYLRACHPAGGLAVWIRYTVHKRAGAAPKGFLWFTRFDHATGVFASKVEHPDPVAGRDSYIRMGESIFAPGRVVGRAPSQHLDAAWDLEFHGDEPPLWHLPRWAYDGRFPRTKLLSPHPSVLFRGRISVGNRRLELDGWPGMVGHNWGAEHARRAIWIHGANFRGQRDAWLDVALGRVGIGPLTTPWIGNGALSLDGVRHRLGGLKRLRSTRVDENVERCRFRLAGDGIRVDGSVGAERQSFVGWIYAQPTGAERQTIHCSIAELRLDVVRSGRPRLTLELDRGAAYELQMDERYPAIPVQPFPDG